MVVYLDHAATTPVLPAAITACAEAMAVVGNPASVHSQGQNAKRMLEEAREGVAASVSCDPIEVVFTGSGTEAINLAVKGLFWARTPRRRILVAEGEHHATLDSVEWLAEHDDAQLEWIPLDALGRIDLDALEAAIASNPADVALVTVIAANNEVGTIQPLTEIAALAAAHDIPMHVDAVSAYGYLPIDFAALSRAGVSAVSLSAHKIGGPVGIGALILGRRTAVVPLLHGGGQQRKVRSGTQDVAAAVSFAVAASAFGAGQPAEHARLSVLRDRVIDGVRLIAPAAILNGDPDPAGRLPGNAHFSFPGCEGDSLLFLLDVAGVSVSTGSACQAGVPEPSHVLRAMGRSESESRGALRITLGHSSSDADVDALLDALPAAHAQAVRAGMSDRVTRA
ncbi:cysteine desulfurase family protein [Cryobacterium psychrophilum]|uniref:Cysteine desulfurase n=1 Tax=Cryobacterium psychrophilum TaxID=41988 RepID=A0A4Y8KP08_9MICO|nr:cysteine desulfurase family protein [Cryobacterium psychrophilum]TDW31258.1 cysteine desulfurase [Cryobacterium psychrophilum]TFD78452.1 cysteine desulfurase [Cryobacterium psychrophilum]